MTSRQKQAILRGIYEENVRLTQSVSVERGSTAARQGPKGFLLLFVAVLIAGGFYYLLNSWNEGLPMQLVGILSDYVDVEVVREAHDDNTVSPQKRQPPQSIEARSGMESSSVPTEQIDLATYTTPFTTLDAPLKDLFGLNIKTIVLDPGHGGVDPGTSGDLGTKEKDVTLDIARRLKDKLKQKFNFKILMTRGDDSTVSLNRRVELANSHGADLFVSLHVNWLPDPNDNVIETYYFGPHRDTATLKLAERENVGSDYKLSDFETLLQNMRDTMKLQESRVLAGSIQRSLLEKMHHTGRRNFELGIKTAPFVVLLGVNTPGVLVEISCMSNPQEEKKLRTETYRDKIADYLTEGIVNYLNSNATKGAYQHGSEKESAQES